MPLNKTKTRRIRQQAKVPKTKTFGGCWTCRRRKVKCDGTRPKCLRCEKDYECEGYDIDLYWVGENEDEPGPSHIRHKSMAVRDDAIPRYCQLDEVQGMLTSLHKLGPGLESARIGPFSIFPVERNIDSTIFNLPRAVEDDLQVPRSEMRSTQNNILSEFEFGPPVCGDWEVVDLKNVQESPVLRKSHRSPFEDEVELIDGDTQHNSRNNQTSSLLDTELRTAVYSNKTIGLLMQNYIANITDLLQPVCHPRNPYQSIYVPNALIGSSNLVLGMNNSASELSFSNVAIFHALLSVSAFHLRGTSYTENQPLFEQLGRFHRAKALQNLRMALLDDTRTIDHHATMAVMLSLVSSDLMEGGMTEFWIHLEGCNRLRSSFSDSAVGFQRRQLQAICLFMTTITKSTNPNIETRPWPFNHDLDYDPLIYLSSPFDFTDSSLEFIYGITATLVSFIHHITKLSKHTIYYASLNIPLPSSLKETCNILGEKIATWSLAQEPLLSIDDACNSQTRTLIQNHMLAFHGAIRIFFHTRLSPCDTSILAAYSRDTLSELQQMENIKIQYASDFSWKAMAPVVWPGFIAACEAADEDRDAWQRWWVRVQSYRIGSIATMWTVVQEVWAEKGSGNGRVALWVDVCRRKGQRIISGG